MGGREKIIVTRKELKSANRGHILYAKIQIQCKIDFTNGGEFEVKKEIKGRFSFMKTFLIMKCC